MNNYFKYQQFVNNIFSSFNIFCSKLVHRFSTGADLLEIADDTTKEGFKMTFATNVFGHFCMVSQSFRSCASRTFLLLIPFVSVRTDYLLILHQNKLILRAHVFIDCLENITFILLEI